MEFRQSPSCPRRIVGARAPSGELRKMWRGLQSKS
jgi:hypothetical protein